MHGKHKATTLKGYKGNMITCSRISISVNAASQKEMPYGLGNTLFMIAGTIGIATKNGYSFGFEEWPSQEFFINPLPKLDDTKFTMHYVPRDYHDFDICFQGFDVPDNSDIHGYLGSWKYFDHCKDLIRHYFTMKKITEPYKDCVILSYRDYYQTEWAKLDQEYYLRALSHFPNKRVIVVTNNPEAAYKAIQLDCAYVHSSPIADFYLLSNADYIVMANSTFSWWGAWLSKAKVVAPLNWFAGGFSDCPTKDIYCPEWILE